MPETAKLLDPGFSVADAEHPRLALGAGALVLEFTDWREQDIQVHFSNVAGVKWQELDSSGPETRDDSVYEIIGSMWRTAYLKSGDWTDGDNLRHFRLCFNACGVLDVLAASMEKGEAAG